jgi:ketosteroid isomerase-like protein
MIEKTSISLGPGSRNRLHEASDPSGTGAMAALETFYYTLNNHDLDVLRADWADSPLAQLNNPVGGILRGSDAISGLYGKIFGGAVRVQVTFSDVIAYHGVEHALFAGRETGSYTAAGGGGAPVGLEIRTSRYFRYQDGRWRQYHHHGSIDDPAALRAYQQAIQG